MQNALALLRQASRLWIIVLRTTLIMFATMMMVALLAFQFYRESIAIIGQPASAQTVIGLQEPLRVVFSHPMDTASVASALTITPATAVELAWNARGTELTILPRASWIADSPYAILLDYPARSATFLPVEPWSMQFNTRAVLRITQFLPAHLSSDVPTDSLVVVRFTQQMVPQTAVQIPLAEPLLQISPNISTTQEWLDTQTLALSSTDYTPNQKYSVTVPATIRDSNGRTLDSALTRTFTTQSHSLNAITPPDGANAVGSNEVLVVTLSGTLDVTTVRSAVQIYPPTDVTFDVQVGAEGASLLTIRPVNGWLYDRGYTVTFTDIGSQRISTVTQFHTAPALALVAQTPPNGQPLQANRELRLVFNAPLDRSTAAAAIHFSPEPIRPARIEVNGNDIRIQGVWATQTAPVLRVDTSLRSIAGNSLPADIIQTFAIDPRATQLALPGSARDIFDSSAAGIIRINVAPHTTAVLTLTELSPATLARVRALTPADFAVYDPTRYGILPFASIPITTELEPSFNIDIQSVVPESIGARVVLARVVDTKGAVDIRFIRIRPAALYALTVGNAFVVGTPLGADEPPHRFEVYQAGVVKTFGTADAEGIWQTTTMTPDVPAMIVDTTPPYDIVERVVNQKIAVPLQIDLLSAKSLLAAGESIPVACARSQTTDSLAATVAMTNASGALISSRAISWNIGQRIANTTLRIPIDEKPGIAVMSCSTATERRTQSVLITPSIPMAINSERTRSPAGIVNLLRISDIAQRPVAGATIYWQDGSTYASVQTDSNGRANIPDTVSDEELIIMTDHKRAIIHPLPDASFGIESAANWYDAGVPFTLSAQLTSRNTAPTYPPIDVTVRDVADNIQIIRTLLPDASGTVTTSLALPMGQWFVVMRAGRLTARTTLHVGELPKSSDILTPLPFIPRDQPIPFLTRAPQTERILIASMRDDGIQHGWTEGSVNGVLLATGITNTTTIDYGYATRTNTARTGVLRISDALCTTASVTTRRESLQRIRVTLTAPPDSSATLAVTNPATGESQWRTNLTVPADGILDVFFADTSTDDMRDIRAIIAHPYCQRVITQRSVLRTQRIASIDAPQTVSIGDVVPVRYSISGLTAGERITLQLDANALLITDPLPTYTGVATDEGTVNVAWNMRVLRDQPSVDISSNDDTHTLWKPNVHAPLVTTSTDGFFLTGRTTLESGRLDTSFDVLRSAADVATALDDDNLATPTVAHLAHLVWLRSERHDTSSLTRALLQAQLQNGGWGYEDVSTVDTLLTLDVVIALSHLSDHQNRIVPIIPLLRSAANNPIVPLAERALAVYALSLQGVRDDDAMRSLSALRDTLGNEGLAAILLSAPLYPDIDARPILKTLANRALPASRGLQWAVDPATSGLHSLAAQNMLVVAALAQAQADPALLVACRSFLLSLRGVGGWGDAIANARAWHMRNVLFPELTNSQRITVTDSSGHLLTTQSVLSAQRIRGNTSIWSDRPVIIGIDYPRDPKPPTRSAVIRQHVYTDQGTELVHLSRLSVDQSVTVVSDVVVLAALPYVRITLPVPALTELNLLSLPNGFSVQKSGAGYVFSLREPQVGVWRIRYRLTAVRSGSSAVHGMQIRDAAGTLHALQTMNTLYVNTP